MPAAHSPLNRRLRRLKPKARTLIAAGLVLALTAGLAASIPRLPEEPWAAGAGDIEAIDVTGLPVTEAGADPTADTVLTAPPPTPVWPSASVVEVASDTAAVSVGGLPVQIEGGAGPVRVETLGQDASATAGIDGVLLRIGEDTADSATVRFAADYTAFANAYGADWSTRLRFTALPECALTTPGKAECVGDPLPTSANDTPDRRVSAALDAGASQLVAISAAPAGAAGDYAATSLSSSQGWSSGSSTGEFNWSYQVPTSKAWNGMSPSVTFGYSSGNVDGRTAASNNQPSWLGEGFEYEPGYIERKYIPCAEDMEDGNNVEKNGDLCWFEDNAFMSLGGRATELIKDADSGVWRPKAEDGSRIEHKTGGPNGDDDGEYWIVTTTEGTRFWFGRNRLPGWTAGKTETESVWTVPVFGNQDGEPCHASTFAGSDCDQAWRWQLDYVEDVWGHTSAYWYDTEQGVYGRDMDPEDKAPFTRGGWLRQIDYGTRSNTSYGTPPNKITFEVADRCLSECDDRTDANWPDVPWDQDCTEDACTEVLSPSFWTTRRLASVTTWVVNGTTHQKVDSVTLRHSFRDPGDGTRAGLFLEGITRKGHVGTELALPEVTFGGAQLANRVDGIDNAPMMNWFRIGSIITESGSEILVDYSEVDCVDGTRIPDEPAGNTWRCFPTWWSPVQFGDPELDWFHKYVVDGVSVIDHAGGAPPVATKYQYLGGAAWHYEDGNGLTKKKHRTWSQWRGFARVRTTVGDPAKGPVQRTEVLFHQGMHGDKDPDGGTTTVKVKGSDNVEVTDFDELAGRPREQLVYDTGTGAVHTSTISGYWRSDPTATREVADRTVHARYVAADETVTSSLLDGGRGTRVATSATTYDSRGRIVSVDSSGDAGSGEDDRCVKTKYVVNESAWIMNLPSKVETYAVRCAAVPDIDSDAQVLSILRMSYDEQAHGAVPLKGAMTYSDSLIEWTTTSQRYLMASKSGYDVYGRVVSATDNTGATITTRFSPAVGGPITAVQTTNALGHVETAGLDRHRGLKSYVTDINGGRTEYRYDGLGRLLKVWFPGRSTGDGANVEYQYQFEAGKPPAVTTKSLIHNGSYVSSTAVYDSLLRDRQSQSPAVGGGRIVSDVLYDSAGRAYRGYSGYFDSTSAPNTAITAPASPGSVERVSTKVFDGLGRTTAEIFSSLGTEKWRTSYVFHGDATDVVPPEGASATTTIVDSSGMTTELRQHHGRTVGTDPTGYDATTYEYDNKGQLTSVTDPVGNVWSSTYDFRGRVIATSDPDSGDTEFTWDEVGRLVSAKDARGEVLAYTYDDLGRMTSVRDDSPTGPKRSEWVYGTTTGYKGLLVSSSRFVDGKEYKTTVDSYDAGYRPLSTTVTIPSGHEGLSGAYTFTQTYNGDGSVNTSTFPAAGGLPRETLTHVYDDVLGMPYRLGTDYGDLSGYVIDTTYNRLGMLKRVDQATDTAPTTPSIVQTFEYETDTLRLSQMVVGRQPITPNRLQELNFGYDAAGNIERIADLPAGAAQGGAGNEIQCFQYDHLARMTQAWTPKVDDCEGTRTGTTDGSDLGGPAPYRQSYEFDKTGSRTELVEHSTLASPVTKTTSYEPPAPGEGPAHGLGSTETTTTGSSGAFTETYGYDPSGNTISRPDGGGKLQELAWDAEGLLSRVSDVDSGAELGSYLYDADGARLIAKDAEGETLYLGGMQLRRNNDGNEVVGTRYYSHAGLTVAVRSSKNGLSWQTADHQGTASLSISQDTTEVVQRRQDPYGNTRGPEPLEWHDKKGFVGGEKDPTGLTSVGARYYDPKVGRFISVDPIMTGDPQQAHGYAYANNTPITSSDPSGLVTTSGSGGDPMSEPERSPSGGSYTPSELDPDSVYGQIVNGLAAGLADLPLFAFLESMADVISCGMDIEACASDITAFFQYIWNNPGAALESALYEIVAPVVDPLKEGRYVEAGIAVASVGVALVFGGYLGRVRKLIKGLGKPDSSNKDGSSSSGSPSGTSTGDPDPGLTDSEMADLKSDTYDRQTDARDDDDPGPKDGTSDTDGKDEQENCNCFVEGTTVAMGDGSLKAIEEVRPGDEVTTYNTDTGEQETHTVTALFHKSAQVLLEFTVDVSGSPGAEEEERAGDPTSGTVSGTDPPAGSQVETFTVTPEHPFWQVDEQAWVDAGELEAGDGLLRRDGDRIEIVAVERLERDAPFTVYNFTVDGTHNYYATAVDTLVHNCNAGEATIHLDPDTRHATITVRYQDESRLVEQWGYTNSPTNGVRDYDPAKISSRAFHITVALPNANGALAFIETMISRSGKGKYPAYDPQEQSCVTFCMQVLRAGGIPDVPTNTIAGTTWLWRRH
ncbi:RHS repeat-associated core domain-containing protein [Phytomonospora endophytica]|uniref:RHS repeat-associated protein n=1 Tax=Phytomonospora endophytica TaxID=714109 RepID=A0A841FXA4_9ACTN|nr:RHS repeat-associated core domain-containing protein [Phytomonospora endophytica]MBB6036600.1 RHS repeat-associated protein [Phytomonospora endophytica]GIG65921.1 type IV secretion protein Rhs [Phytomonospora endophytica]